MQENACALACDSVLGKAAGTIWQDTSIAKSCQPELWFSALSFDLILFPSPYLHCGLQDFLVFFLQATAELTGGVKQKPLLRHSVTHDEKCIAPVPKIFESDVFVVLWNTHGHKQMQILS